MDPMESKIFNAAVRFSKDADNISGNADETWHILCLYLLNNGLNRNSLSSFIDGSNHTIDTRNISIGDAYAMAAYFRNFLLPDLGLMKGFCKDLATDIPAFCYSFKNKLDR